jgi:hypothetical protein
MSSAHQIMSHHELLEIPAGLVQTHSLKFIGDKLPLIGHHAF